VKIFTSLKEVYAEIKADEIYKRDAAEAKKAAKAKKAASQQPQEAQQEGAPGVNIVNE
jgi:hypothetical protein